MINANSGSSSIIAQRTPAVEDRGHADPLQRLRVPEQTEVVEVAILIGNEVVQHDHLIQSRDDVLHAEGLAALHKMLIYRGAVVLLHGPHDPPRADQLRVGGDKVLADAVRVPTGRCSGTYIVLTF